MELAVQKCPEVITRVYEIADNCGNTTTCSQTITITDAIAPSLSCPGGLTATCDISEQPAYVDYAAFTAGGGIASDNCGIDASSFRLVSESSDGASCPEVITRVYEIADNCGNTTTCSQTITITDAIAPRSKLPRWFNSDVRYKRATCLYHLCSIYHSGW